MSYLLTNVYLYSNGKGPAYDKKAAVINESPTKKPFYYFSLVFLSIQPYLVEASPVISFYALYSFICNCSVSVLKESMSDLARYRLSLRLSIISFTFEKFSLSNCNSYSDLLSFSIKLFSLFLLGSISLKALAYPYTARTHFHKPAAASEMLSILVIYILGSCVSFSILFRVFVGILPLSMLCSLERKAVSANSFLATAQLGYLFSKIITALSTTSTPPGGVLYDLTTESLSLVKFAKPCSAAMSAGYAFFKSASASNLSCSISVFYLLTCCSRSAN